MPTRWGKKKKEKEIGKGPIEQCVGDFCSVPRGGVKKKKIIIIINRKIKEKSVEDR